LPYLMNPIVSLLQEGIDAMGRITVALAPLK